MAFLAHGYASAREAYAYGTEDSVSANYFRTMGIPLLAGLQFNDGDNARSPKVLMLSANFAKFHSMRARTPSDAMYIWGQTTPISKS